MSALRQPRPTFFDGLVARPVTLLVIFIALLVVGVLSYVRIPLQMMPDGIVEPGLQVWAQNPGSSAQENEEKVTRVLEEQLRTLPGVEGLDSNSSDDSIWISIRFHADTDMDLAKADVRDRIERARPALPTTVRDVGIWSWSNSQMPIVWMAILHPGDSSRTDFLIDEVVQRRLEAVDGVGRVEVWGVLDDSLRILLDEERVRAANLDLGELITRLSRDNFAEPLGEVSDGGRRVLLRSDMRFKSPEEVAAYPIGAGLTIADVGRVEKVKSVRNRLFKIDGSYAYYGEIQKDTRANVVATCRRLGAALEELEQDPRLEGEFQFLPLFDQGKFIETSLGQLRSTALWGGALAVVVLLTFLRRVRLTLSVAVSIPFSVLLAIAWIHFGGGSFNVLTMTGITLAMGMLVDNSVVVIENISRVHALGRGAREAASEGTREVALAVSLATLTTVVVFLPLIFMSENPILRIMFGELGLPLCLSLLFSLLVALVFLPVVAARLLGERPAWIDSLAAPLIPIARIPARTVALGVGAARACGHLALRGLASAERGLLRVLGPLFPLLAAAILALAAWRAYQAWPAAQLESRLFSAGARTTPASAQGLIANGYAMPAVLALALLTLAAFRWRKRPPLAPERPARFIPQGGSLVDLFIGSIRALLAWTLRRRVLASIVASACAASGIWVKGRMSVAAFGEDENTSRMEIHVELLDDFTLAEAEQELQPYADFFGLHRDRYAFEHLAQRFDERHGRFTLYWEGTRSKAQYDQVHEHIEQNLEARPGHRLRMYGDALDSRSRSMVTFRLNGPSSEELERLGLQAQRILEQVSGLTGVTSASEDAPRQVRVEFDPELTSGLGVSTQQALTSISWALRGWQLPRFQEPAREVPFLIEYDEEEVAGLSSLEDLQVSGGGGPVALSSISELQFAPGSRSIMRRNGQVAFTLTARVSDPVRQRALSDAGYRALRDNLELPRGYSIGEEDLISARQDQEMQEILAALALSVVLVFLLMGILFESFLLPFSVLATMPFAITGAFWTLHLTGTTMDSVGWIGIIILMGVVVNNGIVLIDRIHNLRAAGMERAEAVLEGTAQRVRPVLMTALTTVIGLIPMALSEPASEGIDYRALATCVAGGLTLSTLFTLWVVPLAYTLMDDFASALGRATRHALRPPGRRRAVVRGAEGT